MSTIAGLSAVAGLALVVAGIGLAFQRGANRMKAGLMVVAGVVVLFNAWLNSLPLPN